MINDELKRINRKMLRESIDFRRQRVVYPKQYDAALLHAIVDMATHYNHCFGSFARLFFAATQGTSGKSLATEISSFFSKDAVFVDSSSGAGLLKRLNSQTDNIPTLIVDEAQDYFGRDGNPVVRSVLMAYSKGKKRIIASENEEGWSEQEICIPVIMNGLLNKKTPGGGKINIPSNFLERCIMIKLPKALDHEVDQLIDWVFDDELENKDNYLWSKSMSELAKTVTREDILKERPGIIKVFKSKGIRSRNQQLWRPLAEVANLAGFDTFDAFVDIASYFVNNPNIELDDAEQLLLDFHKIYSELKPVDGFISSKELCSQCRLIEESPWSRWGRDGLMPDHFPGLLKDYDIHSVKNTDSSARGFYDRQFADVWKRVLKLGMPPREGALSTNTSNPSKASKPKPVPWTQSDDDWKKIIDEFEPDEKEYPYLHAIKMANTKGFKR